MKVHLILHLFANKEKSVIELFFNKKLILSLVGVWFFVRKTIILPIIGQRDKRIKRCKGLGLYLSWKDNEETIVDFPNKIKVHLKKCFFLK